MLGGGGGGGRVLRSNSFSVTGFVVGFCTGTGLDSGIEVDGTEEMGLDESGLDEEAGAVGAGTR